MAKMVRSPVLVGLMLLVALRATAQPTQQRLSILGDAQTTLGVAWTTPDEVATLVLYGETSSYGLEQTGPTPALVEGVGYVHEVTLRGLRPGTTYHYQVGDGAEMSEDATFTTAPADPCAHWRLVAIGDNRAQSGYGEHPGVSPNYISILEEAMGRSPNLILNSGDLVIDGAKVEQWVDYLTTTEPASRLVPVLPTIGNHDNGPGEGDTAFYNRVHHLPRNPVSATEDFYSARYANAVFAVLSTETFRSASASGALPFSAQAAWLDQVLTENADATWKIVAYHHPSFTGGGFTILGYGIGHEPDENGFNEAFLPVIDAHHVDLVVVGHNHWYERFLPLVQGDSLTLGQVAPSPDEGTIYITSGGAGAYTMEFDFIPILDVCRGDVDGTRAVCSGQHHYVVFDFADRSLDMEVWSTRCQNVGCEHPPELIDSLSYTKAGTSDCATPDAGVDAGHTSADAGDPRPDAGSRDTPSHDTRTDLGAPRDAAPADAAGADLRTPDSAPAERATTAGDDAEVPQGRGCGCGQADRGTARWLLGVPIALWLGRRRTALR